MSLIAWPRCLKVSCGCSTAVAGIGFTRGAGIGFRRGAGIGFGRSTAGRGTGVGLTRGAGVAWPLWCGGYEPQRGIQDLTIDNTLLIESE